MTTTVHIAVSGNKQVLVESQNGKTILQPGAHYSFALHGDGEIKAREHGEFVSVPELPLVRPYTEPADNDFPLGKACDLSGEGACEACQ